MALLQSSGKLTFLRVHDVGTGFGPPHDFIDVEGVVALDSQPGKGFGFRLREDENASAHRHMLDLLRTAFARNLPVTLDFLVGPGRRNGVVLRARLGG